LISNPIFLNFHNYVDSVQKGGALPHFRRLIATGQNATTSMTGVKYDLLRAAGVLQYLQERNNPDANPANFPNRTYIATGDLCYFALPADAGIEDGLTPTTASNQALTRYYANIAAVDTQFKGMVFTGELREALRLIKSPAKSFRLGIDHYLSYLRRHGRRVDRRRRPSFVRDTWLEYSFGWKPLINDIDSGIKAFYASRLIKPIFEMVRGSARQRVSSDLGLKTASNGPLNWQWRVLHDEEYYVQYYGTYHSKGNGVPDNHVYGFTPSEFIPTLWELLPYSFLVDYFTNIGDIVSSWSYRMLGATFTSQLRRRVHVYRSSDEAFVPPPPDTFTYKYDVSGHPGRVEFRRTNFIRVPDVGSPVPSFEVQVPGMGSVQWLNLLALSKNVDRTRRVLA
jgi:hypothetical protein